MIFHHRFHWLTLTALWFAMTGDPMLLSSLSMDVEADLVSVLRRTIMVGRKKEEALLRNGCW